MHVKTVLLSFITYLCSSLNACGAMATANGIELWYETFGEEKNPALLMVAGGCCQGILWPTEFCEQLAKAGFYVIRYDHRDAGLSTCFDFAEYPYDLLDLAKDGIGLLDALHIETAHVCGLSMGGPVGELMSVYFPGRITTLTLISTSCDFRPFTLACEGESIEEFSLSGPKDTYLTWIREFIEHPIRDFNGTLQARIQGWKILNGSIVPFEENRYQELHREFLLRVKRAESITNHLLANKRSFDLIQTVPLQVTIPTLVIHGSEDPLLPPDHGEALHAAIAHSHYILVPGLGHVLNCQFYDLITQKIQQLASQSAP